MICDKLYFDIIQNVILFLLYQINLYDIVFVFLFSVN
jgi:hypothetical protein